MKNAKLYTLTTILACTMFISACSNNKDTTGSNASPITTPTSEQTVNQDGNTPQNSKSFELEGIDYNILLINKETEKYNYAVKTTAGIVWVPAPKMDITPGTEASPVYFPTEPFTFYLSNSADNATLDIKKSKELVTLPLTDGEAKIVVNGVFGLGDYIIYHTSSIFTDGAQPLRQQAWVMNVNDPSSNKEIYEFHSTGGNAYKFAVDEKKQLYIGVSTIPGNADGSNSYEVVVYDAATGKKEDIKDFTFKNEAPYSIQLNFNGESLTYELLGK